jgi:hypothetical protein
MVPTTDPRTRRLLIDGATVVTVDSNDSIFERGWVLVEGDTISALGGGPVPPRFAHHARTIDGTGHLLTPGLINTHEHLYQWLTRGIAQDSILFDWLVALYPMWSRIDADLVRAGAAGAIAVLARSGCTTVGDHHYVFPAGAGDILFTPPGARWTSGSPMAGFLRTPSSRRQLMPCRRVLMRWQHSTTRPGAPWCESPLPRARRSA